MKNVNKQNFTLLIQASAANPNPAGSFPCKVEIVSEENRYFALCGSDLGVSYHDETVSECGAL